MLALLIDYDRQRHLDRIRIATHSARIPLQSFSLLNDPMWVAEPSKSGCKGEIPFPKKIASHLIDSYYHLPERPDLAFMSLWMSINAAYQELALRESFAVNRARLSDDYGLDCAIATMMRRFDCVIGVNGSFKTLSGHFESLLQHVPEKLTAMMATSWLRSIAAENYACSGRYTSRSYEALIKKQPGLATAVEHSYGEAYTEICNPSIDIVTKGIDYSISDEIKARAIIRSLSKKLKELLGDGATTLQLRGSNDPAFIQFNAEDRVRMLLRNIIYASRNNIAHGKVSSRLNSDTSNRDSYSANIFLYISGYVFLSVLLVELRYASTIVVRQALENLTLLEKK